MKHIIFALTIILYVSNVQAFDLFNSDRGKPPPKPPTPKKEFPTTGDKTNKKLPTPFIAKGFKTGPKIPGGKLLPQKDFALKGTSIIGNKRAAILIAPNKKEFIQYLQNNERTEIDVEKYIKSDKYKGYYLVDVDARRVQIEYPLNAPCKKNKDKEGVQCIDKGNGMTVAALSLKQRKALRAPKPKPVTKVKKNKKLDKDLEKRKEIYKNFKRKVIKDEDVPPGMRVVRTPFGDRLVPIK